MKFTAPVVSSFAESVIVGRIAREIEAWYQYLVENNESRRSRGLPEFEPSYELAEKLAAQHTRPAPEGSLRDL